VFLQYFAVPNFIISSPSESALLYSELYYEGTVTENEVGHQRPPPATSAAPRRTPTAQRVVGFFGALGAPAGPFLTVFNSAITAVSHADRKQVMPQ